MRRRPLYFLPCLIGVFLFFFLMNVIASRKRKRATLSIHQLATWAETGDVVLFSSSPRHYMSSLATRAGSGREWTHVGVLYIHDGVPYVFETGLPDNERTDPYGVVDLLTGVRYKSGVVLLPLAEKLRAYEGYAVVRRLEDKPAFPGLRGFFEEYSRFVYPSIFWTGFAGFAERLSIFGGGDPGVIRRLLNKEGAPICSELTALLYQRYGILSEGKPAYVFLPHNFSGEFVGRCRVRDEVEIEE